MPSTNRLDFSDGAPVGRDAVDGAPAFKKATSFGSPGSDSTVKRIDLNDALIEHPQATFLFRVKGHDMLSAGIADNDVLVVDRSVTPVHGSTVIAVVDGELVCRELYKHARVVKLLAANPAVPAIIPADGEPLELWGVAMYAIKSLAR